MQQAEDFREESEALYAFLSGADVARFSEPTLFKAWTTNDILQHLHFWNEMALFQLEGEAQLTARLGALFSAGVPMRKFESDSLEGLSGAALLAAWIERARRTADTFAKADPKARLKWAGPDMSARSSITARQMETWAHGQAIYDHFGVVRENTDRIGNIARLGVNTYAWTYQARGEPPPGPRPLVKLTSPSGEVWDFEGDEASGTVAGPAQDFCQVVAQTRNVADTALVVEGDIASDWMAKAQCFAGPPETPPAPGARHRIGAH